MTRALLLCFVRILLILSWCGRFKLLHLSLTTGKGRVTNHHQHFSYLLDIQHNHLSLEQKYSGKYLKKKIKKNYQRIPTWSSLDLCSQAQKNTFSYTSLLSFCPVYIVHWSKHLNLQLVNNSITSLTWSTIGNHRWLLKPDVPVLWWFFRGFRILSRLIFGLWHHIGLLGWTSRL